MDKEEFDKIVLLEKERRLSINRIPKVTKEEFITFADAEFCSDYGMAFRHIWDNFKIMSVIETFDIKLNYIITLLENQSKEKEIEPKTKTMLSGRKIVVKGGKNEQT